MMSDSQVFRDAVLDAYLADEADCVNALLSAGRVDDAELDRIAGLARKLITMTRESVHDVGGIEAFMREYDLSTYEGISLMCLAEALLRIPDADTADRLINERLTTADWEKHLGQSQSLFVNASTWGLMLTGRLIGMRHSDIRSVINGMISRSSEPVIRLAIREAMKIIGKQFVMGQSIEAALERSQEAGNRRYSYSYDMLGESALTRDDAGLYQARYMSAIDALAGHVDKDKDDDPASRPGISIKLSALHPRFEYARHGQVMRELVPACVELFDRAASAGISVTIDAEEANRLAVTLDVLENVLASDVSRSWQGVGIAVQAYQKRALPLLDWLEQLVLRHKRRLYVRLVKGAYWDTEIKLAQQMGYQDYPVFTRKSSTDLSYQACVKKLFSNADAFYPQFATHNAYTAATILELAPAGYDYEFQRLHGMGRLLYDQLHKINPAAGCRVYAPVGSHKDLLPYLVRRLLENGANTSFVNRMENDALPVDELVVNPLVSTAQLELLRHPGIPKPEDMYQPGWQNSRGVNLDDCRVIRKMEAEFARYGTTPWIARPLLTDIDDVVDFRLAHSPVDDEIIGQVAEAGVSDVAAALDGCYRFVDSWRSTDVASRADMLDKAAKLFEQHLGELVFLCIREGGRCLRDAIAEVREAIDSCRYYAYQAREILAARALPGPTGESNTLLLHGRGVVACISPWNFPLAIFTGQVVAALVAGNTVIAKPARQTSLTAMRVVELLYKAGVPTGALALLPGSSANIGSPLLEDRRLSGVVFTGSTQSARKINQLLARRPGAIVPLIAETGGINAMIVDSSALPEQVARDVVTSAFNSAGQRCSALRVLFVQSDIADRVIRMIKGAMAEMIIGDPARIETDSGPMIDMQQADMIRQYLADLRTSGLDVFQAYAFLDGNYVAPALVEITGMAQLSGEIFGPVLHVIRYSSAALDSVLGQIRDSGFGLTLGVHSRIDRNIQYIVERARVGNIYVNRDMIGAVVGVQPFGGDNLSGTGPKAGGPNYLVRLVSEQTITMNTAAVGGNASLLNLES
ncbi:MAG: bifunctional proline dehydrogenase/L-glutamate gamma-semialdehyde dehydrogenase PutA [Gammaproteobacteria bacterium]|nr:bifunctional proline dehydrogenase/L-glutamate gamma-semialdehyde dehydrogenase PutA [Gammaproteobacteria bacterium]